MAKSFRREVIRYLSQFGHATPVESLAKPGVPDVYYCIGGKSGWIELKQGRDVLRPSQRLWIRQHVKHGGIAWVLYKGVRGCYLLPGEEAVTSSRAVDYIEKGIKIDRTLALEGLEKWITNSEMVTEYYRQRESR